MARSCLTKDPNIRLSLVSWDQFLVPPKKESNIGFLSEKIRKEQTLLRSMDRLNQSGSAEELKIQKEQKLSKTVNYLDSIIRSTCCSNTECFPSFEVKKRLCNPIESGQLIVEFRSSKSHGFSSNIMLLIWVSLVDFSENLIECRFTGLYSSGEVSTEDLESTDSNIFFKGPFVPEIVKDRLERILYILFEKALDIELSDENKGNDSSVNAQTRLIRIEIDLDQFEGGA